MPRRPIPRWSLVGLVAGAAALSLVIPASASQATGGRPGLLTSVSGHPASGTPRFRAVTKHVEQIRKLAFCGGKVYAVGTFSQILQGSTTYNRNNAFSFSETAPYKVTTWNPNVNGVVNAIAFAGGNCTKAYIGGKFTKIGKTGVSDIAEVTTTGTGSVVPGFKHSTNGQVETLASYQSHLIVGGYFTMISGVFNRYLASLNTTTGADDGLIQLNIHGNYSYPGVVPNVSRVFNQQISHSGTLDLIEGDFNSAGGKTRRQIFMVNLASRPHVTVTGWTSPRFDGSRGYPPHGFFFNCTDNEPFYIRTAAWSPNDQTVYMASTGFRPWNFKSGFPLRGLCDMAAAFTASTTNTTLKWINYDGCYSLYSAAADNLTAYFAGHELWSESPNGCKTFRLDPHRISAPGFEGLDPATGKLIFNPTRSRGIGADDMEVRTAGLWIASDNFGGSQDCAKQGFHAGLCFLPY